MPSILILPKLIQNLIFSDEYLALADFLQETHALSGEQSEDLDTLLDQLWFKEIKPQDLKSEIKKRFGKNEDQAKEFARHILVNTLMLFPEEYGDLRSLFDELGGSEEEIEASITLPVLSRAVQEAINAELEMYESLDPQKEAKDMLSFFADESIVEILQSTSDELKKGLNATIFYIIQHRDGFEGELFQALTENEATIANNKVKDLVLDFNAFSESRQSTIDIAKYLSQAELVKNLNQKDKDLIKQLLTLSSVLRTFPATLEKVPPQDWMIIPYNAEALRKAEAQEAGGPTIVAPQKETSQSSAEKKENASEKVASSEQSATKPSPITIDNSIYGVVARHIIKEQKPILKDQALGDRLEKLLITRLKNIRTSIEIREILLEDPKTGGVGMSPEEVKKIAKATNKYADDLAKGVIPDFAHPRKTEQQQGQKEKAEVPQQSDDKKAVAQQDKIQSKKTAKKGVTGRARSHKQQFGVSGRPLKGSQQKDARAVRPSYAIKEVDGIPMIIEAEELKKAIPQQNKQREQVKPEAQQQVRTPKPTPTSKKTVSLPVRQGGSPSANKLSLSDVRKAPRLVDPIEELRTLTLKDFRRLSPDPVKATKRIYQKISLLGEQSATKRVEGIKAWKESEVGKLYQEIGQESFGSGRGIQEVIRERKAQGKQVVTEPEFDALMELSEMVRF